jgi:DNA-binding Xre family transcriptional regulator
MIMIQLDRLLLERRMSLTELSDRVGVTLANLSILKTGKARAVRFSTLDALCRELDCQPGDLIEKPRYIPPCERSRAIRYRGCYELGPSPMTTTTLPVAQARSRAAYKNISLWTLQGWIAMFFIAAGYAKLTEPMTNLITLMGWPAVAPENMVRGLGVVELVLALGMLAPLISWRVGRPLLLTAASGLIVLETTMLIIHGLSQDIGLAVVNLVLLAFTVPVLLGRRKA